MAVNIQLHCIITMPSSNTCSQVLLFKLTLTEATFILNTGVFALHLLALGMLK